MKKVMPWSFAAAVVALLWLGWWYISKPPLDTSDWDFLEYPEAFDEAEPDRSERELKYTYVAEVDFKDLPLNEAMDFLMTEMNSQLDDESKWSYSIDDAIPDHAQPITLRLTDVPAVEALRYITSLAQSKYSVSAKRELKILALSNPDLAPLGEVEEADFLFPFFYDPAIHTGDGPYDVRSEFVGGRGITFKAHDLEYARYFPNEGRIRVRGHRRYLEEIDMMGGCVILMPPIKDQWIEKIRSYFEKDPAFPGTSSPAIAPAPSSPISGDPFAADPFGGSSSPMPSRNVPTESDPFQ